MVPVSDNQEIFSDLNDENPQYSGNQLIVEILDKTEQPDDQAIQFNFKDLAEDMNATDVNHQEPTHFTSPEQLAEQAPLVKVAESSVSVHQLQGTMRVIPNKKA